MHSTGILSPYGSSRDCVPISHILYVNDMLLFTNGSKKNLEKLMQFLHSYKKVSGQFFNVDKSKFLVHPSFPDQGKHIINQVTSFKEDTFPFTYLGAPISYKKLVIHDMKRVFSISRC